MNFNDVYIDETELIKSITLESFYEFLREFWTSLPTLTHTTPLWNWHIEYLCNELQIVAERVFARKEKEYDLAINISPGSTKSIICSIFFPAWIWARSPSSSVIAASYGKDIALDLSTKARDLLQSDLFRECYEYRINRKGRKERHAKIRDDVGSKSNYGTYRGGYRHSVSVGSQITGRHADFILIDDPLDPKGAVSEQKLLTTNQWFDETIPSRVRDPGITPTILIMQRLHQNDPTARMLEKQKKGGSKVKHICLPAIANDNVNPPELRKYYVNGLCFPDRHSKKFLKEKEAEMTAYAYSGQYMQDPIPLGAQMFKIEKIVIDQAPLKSHKWKQIVRFWDKAGTHKAGCYTVGVKMGIDKEGYFWILDVKRGQWDSAEREEIIKITAHNDGREVFVGVEQEPGSAGKDIAILTIRNLPKRRVIAIRPTGDKIARAEPFSVHVNGGIVRMQKAEWNQIYLDELKAFPYSTYKDQVDASSGAHYMLTMSPKRPGQKMW
jgi:predicted phage terminase large subunit-like protein